MAQSTADRFDIPSVAAAKILYPVSAADTIFQGTMVAVAADGFAVMVSDTAGLRLVGISERQVDNSGGADGDLDVPVQPITALKYVELDAVTPLDLWVGDKVFFTDDHTVNIASGNSILAGRAQRIVRTGATGSVLVSLLERD